MSYKAKVIWKVFLERNQSSPEYGLSGHLLFNVVKSKAIFKDIGGNIDPICIPFVLKPTLVFFQALKTCKRFPYIQKISDGISTHDVSLNVAVHLFEKEICLTASTDEIILDERVNLAAFQMLENHPEIQSLISRILSMVVTGSRSSSPIFKTFKVYPCLSISSESSQSNLTEQQLVSILTRHPESNEKLVTAVISKNNPHQIDSTYTLVDRQGVLIYTSFFSTEEEKKGSRRRFKCCTAMIEYAAAISRELESYFKSPTNFPVSVIAQQIENADSAIPDSTSAQFLWLLLVKEFSLVSRLNKAKFLHEERGTKLAKVKHSKVLIVTVAMPETKAVIEVFTNESGTEMQYVNVNGQVYGSFGVFNDIEIFHCISEMGSGGIGGSQEAVRKAIEALQPNFVIMVGIAFGINDEEQKIGDVLVSSQLITYELQRVGAQVILRGDRPHASSSLLTRFKYADINLKEKNYSVEIGQILSGEKLIDNQQYKEDLISLVPEAIGGEMEGAGLYVACQSKHVEWIIVKAICDWADGNKAKNKKANQILAANNAASYLLAALSLKGAA